MSWWMILNRSRLFALPLPFLCIQWLCGFYPIHRVLHVHWFRGLYQFAGFDWRRDHELRRFSGKQRHGLDNGRSGLEDKGSVGVGGMSDFADESIDFSFDCARVFGKIALRTDGRHSISIHPGLNGGCRLWIGFEGVRRGFEGVRRGLNGNGRMDLVEDFVRLVQSLFDFSQSFRLDRFVGRINTRLLFNHPIRVDLLHFYWVHSGFDWICRRFFIHWLRFESWISRFFEFRLSCRFFFRICFIL